MMTIRIEEDLLRRLREAAKAEDCSVSSKVVALVRRALDVPASPPAGIRPTMGCFSHLDAPDDLEAFRKVRRSLSRSLTRRVRDAAT